MSDKMIPPTEPMNRADRAQMVISLKMRIIEAEHSLADALSCPVDGMDDMKEIAGHFDWLEYLLQKTSALEKAIETLDKRAEAAVYQGLGQADGRNRLNNIW